MDLKMDLDKLAQNLMTSNIHLVGKHCAQGEMDALQLQIQRLRENIRTTKTQLLAKQAETESRTEICNRILEMIEGKPTADVNSQSAAKNRINQNPSSTPSSSLSLNLLEMVDESEFASIPKYMKGRLVLDRINAAVEFINFTMKERYALLRQNPAKMTMEQRQKYYELKESDCEEIGGRCYVTETDLKNMLASGRLQNSFKLDPTGRSILSILRHLGRIKEIRSVGTIRYVAN